MLLPTFIVGPAIERGDLEVLLPGHPCRARVSTPSCRPATHALLTFVDFLAERFGPEPSWDPWWARIKAIQSELVALHGATGWKARRCGTGRAAKIGAIPFTDWLHGLLNLGNCGLVVTSRDGNSFATSLPGVYMSGDIRSDSVKRVASVVGEGSVAISSEHRLLSGGCQSSIRVTTFSGSPPPLPTAPAAARRRHSPPPGPLRPRPPPQRLRPAPGPPPPARSRGARWRSGRRRARWRC